MDNPLSSSVRRATGIFGEYGEFIHAVIAGKVSDSFRVDDLYQGFFLSLVADPVPLEVDNIKGYLYRMITRDVIDHSRRAGHYLAGKGNYRRRASPRMASAGPEERVIHREEEEKIFGLVGKKLPASQARSILLRFRHGYSTGQVAEEMGVDDRSVSRYVCVGLRKLRQILREMESETI